MSRRKTSESVFYISADGVKIGGLTIQGSERAGIELDSSDGHMILSNRILGNPAGILLNFSNEDTIYRNYYRRKPGRGHCLRL